jgi:hypothetical protein
MSQNHSILTLSIAAAAVLAANRFVTADGNYPAAGGSAIGATRSAAAAIGDLVPADIIGTAVLEAGAAVAQYGKVQSDATGRAIPATASTVRQAVIAGGAAGAHVATGILTTDRLVSVVQLNRDGTAANINIADLTSEFAISDDDEIDNAGGTATTGDSLLVTWETEVAVRGIALEAAADAGDFIEVLLFQN